MILRFLYFQSNTFIEKLDLEGNCIEADGAMHIARVLKDNLYINHLVSCFETDDSFFNLVNRFSGKRKYSCSVLLRHFPMLKMRLKWY